MDASPFANAKKMCIFPTKMSDYYTSMGFGFFSNCLKIFIENTVGAWVFVDYSDLI
jgi:hypothetical protein